MSKFLASACVVVASLLHPWTAAADSLNYTSLGSGSWVNIRIGSVTETGWAGEINWLMTTPTIASKAITTYCADLFDDAKIPTQLGTLKTTAALDLDNTLSHGAVSNAGTKAAYLVNTNASGAHGSNIQAAGLQIAIWQAMFGSTFTVLSSTLNYSAIMTAAAGYSVPAGVSSVAGYFDVVNGTNTGSSANGQDQVLVGTPEPATMLLLTFAIVGLLGYQRRFSRTGVRA
jgi:hypothetical protein